jgi:hypothetical protein
MVRDTEYSREDGRILDWGQQIFDWRTAKYLAGGGRTWIRCSGYSTERRQDCKILERTINYRLSNVDCRTLAIDYRYHIDQERPNF